MDLNEHISLVLNKLDFLNRCGYIKKQFIDTAKFSEKYHVLIFENELIQKRIEIVLKEVGDFIDVVIRKQINNEWAAYNDEENTAKFDDVLRFFVGEGADENKFNFNLSSRKQVIMSFTELFEHHKDFFCTDKWFDMSYLRQLKIDRYKNKLNIDLTKLDPTNTASFQISKILEFLQDEGYTLVQDANTLPFYKSLTWFIIYQKGNNTIECQQQDWRDFTHLYNLIINGKNVAEFDMDNYTSYKQMAEHIKYVLKETI
jgi:hypothetical protein